MSARLMPAVALTLALVAACGEDPVQPASQGPDITPAEGLTEVEAVSLFPRDHQVVVRRRQHGPSGRDPVSAGGAGGTHRGVPGRQGRGKGRDLHDHANQVRDGEREQYVRRGREPRPHDPDAHRDRTGWVRRVRRHPRARYTVTLSGSCHSGRVAVRSVVPSPRGQASFRTLTRTARARATSAVQCAAMR